MAVEKVSSLRLANIDVQRTELKVQTASVSPLESPHIPVLTSIDPKATELLLVQDFDYESLKSEEQGMPTPLKKSEDNDIVSVDVPDPIENNDTNAQTAKRTSLERQLKESGRALRSSLEMNSKIMTKLTNVDSKLTILEKECSEIKTKESNSSTHDIHLQSQIDHHETMISKLQSEKEALMQELHDLMKAIESQEKEFEQLLTKIDNKIKIKKHIKETAHILLKTAKDTLTLIKMTEGVLLLNKTGETIRSYQETKEKLNFTSQAIIEIDAIINELNEDGFVDNAHTEIDALKRSVARLEKQLVKHPRSSERIQQKIIEHQSRINELKANVKAHASELAALKQKKIILEHDAIILEKQLHGLKQEILDSFQSAIAKYGIEGLQFVYENVDRLHGAATMTIYALTLVQAAESVVGFAEPILHGIDLVLPIFAVPFGLLEVGKSGYNIYKAGKHHHQLKQIKTLARQFQNEALVLKDQMEQRHGVVPDIALEVLRLREVLNMHKVDRLRLSEINRLNIEQFKDNFENSDEMRQLESETLLAREQGDELEALRLTELRNIHIRQAVERYKNSEESTEIQSEIDSLTTKITNIESSLTQYHKIQLLTEKSNVLNKYISLQKRKIYQKYVNNGINAVAGGTLVAAGVIGIVGIIVAPVIPAGVPVAALVAVTATGIKVVGIAEEGAYHLGTHIYESYKSHQGKFEDTEAGILYSLGLYMREEMNSDEKPITKAISHYNEIKHPEQFIEKSEKTLHKLARHHPKASEFQREQAKMVFISSK